MAVKFNRCALQDPRWTWVYDKNDQDHSNGMRTYDDRSNHRVYEGCEPAYKLPPVCQHKRGKKKSLHKVVPEQYRHSVDFYPVNVDWGLAYKKRKEIAQWKHLDKNRFLTSYTQAYGPDTVRYLQPHPYVDHPPSKQIPLVFYRRPEMREFADISLNPATQIVPPRAEAL